MLNPPHPPLGSAAEPKAEPKLDVGALRQSLLQTWKDLEGVKEEIRAITDQVEKACISLRRLRETEKELFHIAETTAPLLSPFQHLPRDILAEIAERILVMDNRTPHKQWGVWPLTHVCKAWRSDILSSPHLWSTLSIPCGLSPKPELVSTALERSMNNPLSLKITGVSLGVYSPEVIENTSRILTLLTEHSTRWKSLELGDSIPLDPLLDACGHLPLLENLILAIEQPDEWEIRDEHSRIFAMAPKLRRLSFWDDYVDSPFDFPVQQLHHLKCQIDNGESFMARTIPIPQCKSLISLHILTGYFNPRWDLKEGIVLPVLKHLKLHLYTSILRWFRLPSLQSLVLRDIETGSETVSDVQAFLQSSRIAGLSSFGFSVCNGFTGDCVEQLLSLPAFRSVHALTFKDGNNPYGRRVRSRRTVWMESLLLRLVYNRHETGHSKESLLLPGLRKFKLELRNGPSGDGLLEALREFIISRTTVVDEANQDQDRSNSGLLPIPSRLEEVYTKYSENKPLRTTEEFNHAEAKVSSLMESLDCRCRSVSNMLFSHVTRKCVE